MPKFVATSPIKHDGKHYGVGDSITLKGEDAERLLAVGAVEEVDSTAAKRLAAEQAEAARKAQEEAEAARKAQEEADAAQKAEVERLAAEQAEAERLAAEKAAAGNGGTQG